MKITTPNFKRAKLLVIEDNDDQWFIVYQAIRYTLPELQVIRVSTAHYAQELLEEWAHQEWELPKLILLDLYLPTNDKGWQLLSRIKAMGEPFNRIPIVMLSSSEAPADIEQAYQLGISSYMTKPIRLEGWVSLFREIRTYWWETVTLPPIQYGC